MGFKTIIAGLGYSHSIEPVEIEAGSRLGSAQGEIKRIDEVIARLYRTAQLSFGESEASQEPVIFKEAGALMGNPINLFTGDKDLEIDADYDRNATVVLTGDAPLPCNITCIIIKGSTHE